ncbi:hypothetical protein BJ972_002090 [Agromyces atrinae]|uniref:Uncharacterized protein n=1 Tax=Agromyces atrinae TaxID=592376 RepID=A0A852SI70_9MICO|nr:hypothetical protein [Agromyces atrinae]
MNDDRTRTRRLIIVLSLVIIAVGLVVTSGVLGLIFDP